MKILFISGSYPPIHCGVGDYTAGLIAALKKTELQVKIVTSTAADPAPEAIPVVKSWTLRALPTIVKAIKAERPDLIHLQYPGVMYGKRPFINLLPWFLRLRFRKTPLALTIHEYHDASWLGRLRIAITLLPIKNLVVTNQIDQALIQGRFRSKHISLISIGNNIPQAPLTAANKKALTDQYQLTDQTVAYFGFIDPSKGVEQLIASSRDWPEQARLLLITSYNAEDPYHQQIQAQVAASNGKVVWTGFLPTDTASQLFQLSTIMVLPFDQPISLRRSSLIASLANGVPTIVTGPAQPPLENGVNCVTIPNNAASSITAAVVPLLEDDKLRKILRVNAYTLANTFDWGTIADKHTHFYQTILS